jgi:hypothetical protein
MYSIIKTEWEILIFIFVLIWCVIAVPDKYTGNEIDYLFADNNLT